MQGNLDDMAIADLIQHNCENRKTAILNIQHADQQACLYFKDGNIAHAMYEDFEGEEAVYKVMNWEIGTFDLELGVEPPKITITQRWAAILLESARCFDEDRFENDLVEPYQTTKRKDDNMNIKRLNKVLEDIAEDLGKALIAADCWKTGDATKSLASFNAQPKTTTLFNETTCVLDKNLKDSGFPGLGKYYMIHLENDFMVIVVQQGEFQADLLVDLSETMLGVVINIALPKVMRGLAEAAK